MKGLTNIVVILVLLLAALLETTGDALVRNGLKAGSLPQRTLWMLAGASALLAYGCIVNTPRWNFGRLLGVYVVLFFVVAQGIAWLGFQERPNLPLLVGGAFIVLGGGIISFCN